MSDVTEKTHLTGTVGFTRKISTKQYESAEASAFGQFDFDVDAPSEEVARKAQEQFRTIKAVVLEELGIPFELDESGLIREIVERAFPGTTDEGGRAGTPGRMSPQGGQQQRPAPAQAPQGGGGADACKSCGGTDFYDNRAKKQSGQYKPSAPDFKCKGCGTGVWAR